MKFVMLPTQSAWRTLTKYAVLATLPVVLLLALAELIARAIPGDPTIHRPFFLPVGHEEYYGTSRLFVPYRALRPYYWLPVPNTPVSNSRGLRGHEITTEKPRGRVRIACMGCSCTVGGQESYPERLERLLRETLGIDKYEVINGGAGANSTYQGLLILQRHILELHPDIVTVYYGWNDRWVHDGRRDSRHRLPSVEEKKLVNTLSKSRFVRCLLSLADKWRGQTIEQRVPPEEYASNLRQFVRICRQRNIRVILCTTPDGMTRRAIESRFSLNTSQENWYRDLYLLYRDKGQTSVDVWNYIQKLYNDRVREVAAREGVEILDLDALVRERRKLYGEPPQYFFKDGIHFSELGLQEIARLFADHILQDSERAALDKYLNSPEYCRVNAGRFIQQHQYSVADYFLSRAETTSDSPIVGADQMRATIAAERPFYDQYYAAQFEVFNQGDVNRAIKLMADCLRQRPEDENLRVDFASLAFSAGLHQLSLQTVQSAPALYSSRENFSRALQIGLESARWLGETNLVNRLAAEIPPHFPDDAAARETRLPTN